jgi:ribosomal protein S18 acetylase RimI-like enzyme
MNDDVTIRAAAEPDLEQAARLGAEIVRRHHAVNPNRFFMLDNVEAGYAWWLRQELDRPAAVVLVAERAGEIVGYAYGAIEERDWSILIDKHGALHDLCVAESARGMGIGRAMTLELMARLRTLGAPRYILRAMVQNEAALKLAKSVGFEPTMIEMTRELEAV